MTIQKRHVFGWAADVPLFTWRKERTGRVILVVIFDNRTSLGLVRLRVKRANEQLTRIFEMVMAKAQDPFQASPFAEITDDDIDNLFND